MIYTRIDTYSVILYGSSINAVLNLFNLPADELNKAFETYSANDVGMGSTFVLKHNGIRFDCKKDEYDFKTSNVDVNRIFDIEWTWIRLYISGEGIDYIENCNINNDFVLQVKLSDYEFFSDISVAHEVTRCDFAFDYINYEGNEFERLRKLIASADFDDNLSLHGRLYTGVGSGISYSYKGGREHTIYFGTPTSDRMLRIYDKKFQLCDENGNWKLEKVPAIIKEQEVTIESWYRVELQTRTAFAERYLISSQGDFRFVMGEIASFFDVRTSDGKTIAPLHKIFLWTKRTPIIQNANSAQPRNELDATSAWVRDIASTNILALIGALGWDGFRQELIKSVKSKMNLPLEQRIAYLNKVNNKISIICQQTGISISSIGSVGDLIKFDDGAFYPGPFPVRDKDSPYVTR